MSRMTLAVRPRRLRRLLALTAFGAILAGGAIGAATDAQAMPPEQAYIATLDAYGVYYSTPQAAVQAGYAVCNALDAGNNVNAIVTTGQLAGGYSRADAETIVGASIGALCPRYMPLVGGTASQGFVA